VTSQGEFDFVSPRLSGSGWFGASDAATEGDWRWVTGPETGTSFWSGASDGTPVNGLFSNWSGGEPNESSPGEDCAQFYSGGGGWNDLPCNATLDYYVVEYGTPSDLPTAPPSISFSVTVNTPTALTIPIATCADLIGVYNNGADNRYDNLQLNSNVDCTGSPLLPMFDQDDVDFGQLGFRGEFDGQGYAISNIDIDEPLAEDVGLFAFSNGATFRNITLSSGTITGDYCVGGFVGSATNTNFVNAHSGVTINGDTDLGGFVGCYDS
jgi:hypothetical protein